MPRKTFTAGDELLDSELNTYLMDQAVMTFASASARATAIPSATEGMLTYLDDINQYQGTHGGTTWLPVAGQMPLAIFTRATAQSIANDNSNATIITFPTQTELRNGITYSSGSFTLEIPGLYHVSIWGTYASNTTGRRYFGFELDGNLVQADNRSAASSGNGNISMSMLLKVTANQVLTATTLQNSGAALNLSNARITISYVCA